MQIPQALAAAKQALQTRQQQEASTLRAGGAGGSREFADAAAAFAKEWISFTASAWGEFHRDVAKLPLPELLLKWGCVADALGVGFESMSHDLRALKILNRGSARPVVSGGQYFDPDTEQPHEDWHARSDMMELHAALREIAMYRAAAMNVYHTAAHRQQPYAPAGVTFLPRGG